MLLIKPLGSIVYSQPLEEEAAWSSMPESCGGDGKVGWGHHHGEVGEMKGFNAWSEN